MTAEISPWTERLDRDIKRFKALKGKQAFFGCLLEARNTQIEQLLAEEKNQLNERRLERSINSRNRAEGRLQALRYAIASKEDELAEDITHLEAPFSPL